MRFIWILLFLAGCAVKSVSPSTPVVFIFKTPSIKIAATGFLQKGNVVRLQGYSAGNALFTLKLAKRVCINGRCLSYELFNKKFLSSSYPPFLIKKILLKKPIMQKRGLEKQDGGFMQKIASDTFAIIYTVTKRGVRFLDTKNHILIKIKEIDG